MSKGWMIGALGLFVLTVSPFGLASDSHGHGHAAPPKKSTSSHSAHSKKVVHRPAHRTIHVAKASHAEPAAPVGNVVKVYPPTVDPSDALGRLKEGNQRFVSDAVFRPRADSARRAEIAKKQRPHTVVVTCSDSRLAPELIFDQGLGDLFVVRVAGNTIDKVALGSIEYALEHLEARLVVVLGHERCGAVDAAMKGGHAPGAIGSVVDPIQQAIRGQRTLDNAIEANVRNVKTKLVKADTLMKELVHGGVKIVGARYDLDSGYVDWLP